MKVGYYWFLANKAFRTLYRMKREWEIVKVHAGMYSGNHTGWCKSVRGNLLVSDMKGRFVGPLEKPELTEEEPK